RRRNSWYTNSSNSPAACGLPLSRAFSNKVASLIDEIPRSRDTIESPECEGNGKSLRRQFVTLICGRHDELSRLLQHDGCEHPCQPGFSRILGDLFWHEGRRNTVSLRQGRPCRFPFAHPPLRHS